jgi:hypothetical protein
MDLSFAVFARSLQANEQARAPVPWECEVTPIRVNRTTKLACSTAEALSSAVALEVA